MIKIKKKQALDADHAMRLLMGTYREKQRHPVAVLNRSVEKFFQRYRDCWDCISLALAALSDLRSTKWEKNQHYSLET